REPGAERVAIAELMEPVERSGKRVLGDLLGILTVAQDAVRDAERKARGIAEPGLERAVEAAGVVGHDRVENAPAHPFIHCGSGSRTKPSVKRFICSSGPYRPRLRPCRRPAEPPWPLL